MKMRFSETLTHYQHDSDMLSKQKQIEETQLSLRWAITLFAVSVIVILLLINIIVQKHRARKLQEAKMRISIAALRMETVRNRITPHFISNALTAEIMAQMEGKPVNLDSLVQLLHRGIELTDVEQSTLSEELEFIQFYCSIESRSVGPDFHLSIDVPDGLDTDQVQLPSMAVQILVENAIKHGLKARQPEPGKKRCVWVNVKPQEEATLIEVIDNGVGLAEERKNKERTGLRVMRQTIFLLNEQYMQTHGRRTGKPLMDYGLANYAHPDGQRGCRAWLLLPNDFDYILEKKEDKAE
jgi:LytS/YehU family sensor histidine kinase